MIEDKKDGVKIALNPAEALLENTISRVEKEILAAELELEIQREVLGFLREKRKKLNSA